MPYGADEVLGSILYAKETVPVKDLPEDVATIITTIYPGELVGTIDTYYAPKQGRASVYWGVINEETGSYYYVEHKQGRFTLVEATEEANNDSDWWDDPIEFIKDIPGPLEAFGSLFGFGDAKNTLDSANQTFDMIKKAIPIVLSILVIVLLIKLFK